jgi:hypothetical protein
MAITLATYLATVRSYLHDPNAAYWSDADLTSFINAARDRVVADTGCSRVLQTVSTVVGQEQYLLSSFPAAGTIDVLNVTNTTTKAMLAALSWTQLNREIRMRSSANAAPTAFAMFGPSAIYISPPPDAIYAMECDTVTTPAAMVNTTDTETIPYPFTDAVPFYAARLAKLKLSAIDEANAFMSMYQDMSRVSRDIPSDLPMGVQRTQATPAPAADPPIGIRGR